MLKFTTRLYRDGEFIAKAAATSHTAAKIDIINYVTDEVKSQSSAEIVTEANGDYLAVVKVADGVATTRYWALSCPPPRWSFIFSPLPSTGAKGELGRPRPSAGGRPLGRRSSAPRKSPEEAPKYKLAAQEWRDHGEMIGHSKNFGVAPVIWLTAGRHSFFHTKIRKPRKDSRIRCSATLQFGERSVDSVKFFRNLQSAYSFVYNWRKNIVSADFYELITNIKIFAFNPTTLQIEFLPEWSQFPELGRKWKSKKKS